MTTPRWDVALRGRLGDLEIDFAFATDARRIVVVGPNGAGKSTLLRAIVGATLGLKGHIRVAGTTWQGGPQQTPPEVRRIGYVPQGCGLFTHLSVRDNVRFGCRRGADGLVQTATALARVGATHLAERRCATLSGGERRRVALARALAPAPKALLLDEPLAALDPVSRIAVRTLLVEQLADRDALTVTHDERDVATLGDWLLVVEGGRVVQQGTPAAVARAPATAFCAAFFADRPRVENYL